MSRFPAERFSLAKRGQIKEGYFADIVIFNPDTIIDKATFANPQQHAVGVRDLLVNGIPILRNENPILEMAHWPGRYLPADLGFTA